MENIIDPSVQEMMRDIEQPDREASPGLFDELLQNEGSRRSKGHGTNRKRDKKVINLILRGGASGAAGGSSSSGHVIITPKKIKSGGSRSSKRSKIFRDASYQSANCQNDPYMDRLRHKELELHKKNAEILELMIKANLPADTINAFISKASFDRNEPAITMTIRAATKLDCAKEKKPSHN